MCLPASCLIPLTCSGQHNGQHASEQHDRGNPGHSTRGLMAGAQHATRIASHVRHASCTHVNWLQVWYWAITQYTHVVWYWTIMVLDYHA